MPISKRNKHVSLTRTTKNALEMKKNLVEQVCSCVDKYTNLFVFSVNDMRNSKLKEVRDQWKDSRFFFGKNKVMAMALGRNSEEEYKTNLHRIADQLHGQCGLLFSNKSKNDVLVWFESYSNADYARSGNTATCDVDLEEGPHPEFHHSLEPYLRQLGMPTSLKGGIVQLVKDFQVCKENEVLTPEKAKILEFLGYQMAEFRISIDYFWSSDGTFEELKKSTASSAEENLMEVDQSSTNELQIGHTPKRTVESDSNDESVPSEKDVKNVEFLDKNDPSEKDVKAVEFSDKKVNKRSPLKRKLSENGNMLSEKHRRKLSEKIQSSPDEQSPVFRSLRNRTVKIRRKK